LQTSNYTAQTHKNLYVSQSKLLKGIILFFGIALFSYCTKIKGTDIGAELIPLVDNVNTFDTTFEVVATTSLTPDSSLPLLGRDASGSAGSYVLGYISNNLQFGKTKASIYFELKPPTYPFSFENVPDSLFLDSSVLCLKYDNTFGDTNAVQSISVFKINELLKGDSAYRTNKSVSYSELIGSKSFTPSILNDSLFLFRQNTKNQLRIRLNNSFGSKILTFDTTKYSPLNNDSLFRDYFKGFALVPETGGVGASANALMSLSISDTSTYYRIYYRYNKNGKQDTTYKDFKFNNGIVSASVNKIERVYTGSEITQHLGNKVGGDSLVYIQAAPGTFSMLNIPGINSFKTNKGNVMVHLAELSMEEAPTPGRQSTLFFPPLYLYPEIYDTTTKSYYPFLSDGFVNGSFDDAAFGGIRKFIVDKNNQQVAQYKMNLTRYVQGIVTRNYPNMPFRLSAPYSIRYDDLFISFALNNLSAGNIVLGGGNHSTKKMKLRVVYSKL